MSKNIKIFIGAVAAAIFLFILTPFFPLDELAAVAIAIISGIKGLLEK